MSYAAFGHWWINGVFFLYACAQMRKLSPSRMSFVLPDAPCVRSGAVDLGSLQGLFRPALVPGTLAPPGLATGERAGDEINAGESICDRGLGSSGTAARAAVGIPRHRTNRAHS